MRLLCIRVKQNTNTSDQSCNYSGPQLIVDHVVQMWNEPA